MTIDDLIDYLEQCRGHHGGETRVVLSADDIERPQEFIALDQMPGLND